jgi:hypothetical protein
LSGSISRVLYPRRGGGHYTGPAVADRLCRKVSPSACNLPAGICPGRASGILGLAGGGVCPAVAVTDNAVRSYRTISPLPVPRRAIGGVFSAALSRGSPRAAVSRHRALSCSDFPPDFSIRRPPDPLKNSIIDENGRYKRMFGSKIFCRDGTSAPALGRTSVKLAF